MMTMMQRKRVTAVSNRLYEQLIVGGRKASFLFIYIIAGAGFDCTGWKWDSYSEENYHLFHLLATRTEAEILEHFNVGSLAKTSSKTLLLHYGCLVLKFRGKADAGEFLRQVNGWMGSWIFMFSLFTIHVQVLNSFGALLTQKSHLHITVFTSTNVITEMRGF